MNFNMRRPIAFLVTVASLLTGAQASAEGESTKRYRVIFNCDGHAVAKDANGDVNQWIENLFGPLEKSHVDALFWCDGAGGNTANYDSKVLERTGARAGKPRTYIDEWIDAGNDPPKVVVREAKKRGLDVFYSFRINDIHDSFMPDEMATFKVKNPEWMIGERKYGDVMSFKTALNFAVPEVREIKFRVIEELFQKYDFDGLEIDFLRGAPYFLPGTEDKNAHLLTELLQRVREHLNERGKERGRPIRLAVRVDESLKSCKLDGFDVATWVEQDLVDMMALGSGVMDIEIEEFKKLAAAKGVHVYPCLYGWPSKYSPIPAELATGLTLNYWGQGADGIYLFNWFPHTKNNSESTGPYMAGLLKQMGDPAALRAGQEQLMFAADRGRPERAYQYNWLHCVLPERLPADEPLEATIRVFDKFKDEAKLTLKLHVEHLPAEDSVTVKLNGQSVAGLKRDSASELSASIRPAQLRFGSNQVAMQLVQGSAESAKPQLPIVTALELHATRSSEKPLDETAALVPIRITQPVNGHIHPAVCVSKQGTLVVIYGQVNHRDLRITRSKDGGKTWTPTEPFVHTVGKTYYPGSLTTLSSGQILHAWNRWSADDNEKEPRSVLYSLSSDEGVTWSDPKPLPRDPQLKSIIRHPLVELSADQWLFSLMDKTIVFDPTTGEGKPFGDGRVHELVPIVRTPKGTFVSGQGLRSTDEGKTWSKVDGFPDLATQGWRHEMVCLSNGWLLASEILGPGFGGERIRYMISRDDGVTWKDVFEYYNPGRAINGRACPRTVQLDSNTIGVVFYDIDKDQEGGPGLFFLRIPIASLKG